MNDVTIRKASIYDLRDIQELNNDLSLKTPIKNLDLSLNNELKDAINKSIKDFKATLFINNLIINDCDFNYKINKIELNLETK